ncbi:hypothetical protein DERP_001264, partial [Dermatophagoides pteronyssinus]
SLYNNDDDDVTEIIFFFFKTLIRTFRTVNRQYDKKNAKNPHLEIDDDHDLKMNQIS